MFIVLAVTLLIADIETLPAPREVPKKPAASIGPAFSVSGKEFYDYKFKVGEKGSLSAIGYKVAAQPDKRTTVFVTDDDAFRFIVLDVAFEPGRIEKTTVFKLAGTFEVMGVRQVGNKRLYVLQAFADGLAKFK